MNQKASNTERKYAVEIVATAAPLTFTKRELIRLTYVLQTAVSSRLRESSLPRSELLCGHLFNAIRKVISDLSFKETTGSLDNTKGNTVILPEPLVVKAPLVRRCLAHGTVDCFDCTNQVQGHFRGQPEDEVFEWVEVENGHN